MSELIERQAAIDIERNATVDTNPSHFEAHQKFTQFMDDAEISSFGRWQWSNGFNTALTAVGIDLKKLPTIQPVATDTNVGDTISRQWLLECINDGWIKFDTDKDANRFIHLVRDIAPSAQPEKRTEKRTETHACDLISRPEAIDAVDAIGHIATMPDGDKCIRRSAVKYTLSMLPSAQTIATDTNIGDKISKFIDDLEETFAYIREREGGDSVCGLCEYDGAYIGESGDWCNECPGFDRDDCFKLSDKIRRKWTEEIIKALPTIQPEQQWGRFERKRDGVFCSVCHNGWEFITGVPVEVEREYRYCPYCGAKMTISK